MTKPFEGVISVDITESVPDWELCAQPIAPDTAEGWTVVSVKNDWAAVFANS